MSSARGQFDEQLFLLKLSGISHQMQEESVAARRRSIVPTNLVDAQIRVLSKYLEEVDRICREVWLAQRNTITPEFLREVLLEKIVQTIQTRKGAIVNLIEMTSRGPRQHERDPLQRRLAFAARRLIHEMSTQYEVEARELGYEQAPPQNADTENENRPEMFLESSSGRSPLVNTAETIPDYSKFSRKRLQKRFENTQTRLAFLIGQYPQWEQWGGGYGPGNAAPPYYLKIRQLEKERDGIVLELSNRRILMAQVDTRIERSSNRTSSNGRSERRAFVEARLAEKGWSIVDWAKHSSVDYHTAEKYLKGKSQPFASTRKKLADSLGVKIDDLPK